MILQREALEISPTKIILQHVYHIDTAYTRNFIGNHYKRLRNTLKQYYYIIELKQKILITILKCI
ncbi:hypothetical protein C8R26_1497 [Nitrosomonas oligotropha]|uniref:Uncharacterized protein n=1 Tax=Nitrosomonas oligotropha TaxID=42354 RepID=A0A2T5H4M9_9PROT|nr:hypothetical protein C8R26_1497 [Nitrosomonas oligotropha]